MSLSSPKNVGIIILAVVAVLLAVFSIVHTVKKNQGESVGTLMIQKEEPKATSGGAPQAPVQVDQKGGGGRQ